MLSQFETADNMDLISLFKICEDYYLTKFGKRPIFTRKLCQLSDEKGVISKFRRSSASRRRILQQIPGNDSSQGSIVGAIQRKVTSTNSNATNHGLLVNGKMSLLAPVAIDLSPSSSTEAFKSTVTGTSLNTQKDTSAEPFETKVAKFSTESEDSQTVKPFPFGDDSELRNLAAALRHDILHRSPGVEWEDVVELDNAKQLLQEAVIYPLKYPALFTGLLSPWRGILLFGPPGTGKTLLAKAVASQSGATFFNIAASSIISKYRGDSEKLIRVLFELARYYAPSTIFVDELDSLMGHRGEDGEHESSRRMKTELLVQMDGLTTAR